MSFRFWAVLILPAALLVFQFFSFDVLQDDAFISFRYIRNFLDGFGLVFNLGERVEGYTNFFWIILLALLAKLGLPLIETARVLGILAGLGTILAATYAARKLYPTRNWMWILSVPMLLASTGALAYWSGSGLETGLFTFLVAVAAVTYLFRPNLSLLLIALATLTRPEGALLAFLFGIAGIILKEKSWKTTLVFWGSLALLLLPYAVFKWFYYGALLPNPFYAKTGFSQEYLVSGLAYVWLFLKHYGGYGLFLLLPLFFWKKLTPFSRFCLFVFFGYTLYLIAIGGDVLKAHRFFVTVLVFLYLPFADGLFQFFSSRWYKNLAFAAVILPAACYAYKLPLSYLQMSAKLERELTVKMRIAGLYFAEVKAVNSIALTTIGAFSYYAGYRRVIDMIGLTEPAVAKNPERVEGLLSSWKERHFNAGHVLSQKPEVILFSTGLKPSAPAERALFLYSDFRRNYRLEFVYPERNFLVYYRRFQDLPAAGKADMPARLANLFNEAINLVVSRQEPEKGIPLLRRLLEQGPEDCPTFYTALGHAYLMAGSSFPESAYIYLKKGMDLDHGGSISQLYLINFLFKQKDYKAASEHLAVLSRTVPNAADFFRRRKLPPGLRN